MYNLINGGTERTAAATMIHEMFHIVCNMPGRGEPSCSHGNSCDAYCAPISQATALIAPDVYSCFAYDISITSI
jgi:hypothetical protein